MDDLNTGLARARRQPWLTRSTTVMIALVIGCGGFLAGIQAEQNLGDTTPAATAGSGRGGFQPPAGFPIPGAGQNPAGATGATNTPTTGKIKLIDGTTVYVETTDGRIITVKTSSSTVVQSATATELKKLTTGTSVTVTGTTAGTDTLTANTITATK